MNPDISTNKTFYRKKVFLILIFLSIISCLHSQSIDTSLYSCLRWRNIGPYRGGRTVGASGVPSQPNVFYIGVNDGGVWKTTDYGRTWFPIFDDQSTGSIGCVTVAPSNPDIVYVGSGEGLHRPDLSVGNGIYKSVDAGKTWIHLGLRDGQQIPKIAVDPDNPDRVFVAVLGHPYGPNSTRGIYRSLNGGKTFENVLYIDENTGGDDVVIDPLNPQIIYATLWQGQEAPWENGEWSGTKGGIFKSKDGGNNWEKIDNGLPKNIVQAHIAIAQDSTNIIYAAIGTSDINHYGTGTGMGIYRSSDGGLTWKKDSEDGRPEARIGGGDVPVLKVDPKNPEVVYSASIVLWKSTDGGKHWTGIRGAPGGDDYQNLWINPNNPEIMLVTGDQGAIITVNGGESWSSWYNQPTAQLYHVSADNDFPYNLYSGQQESGSVGIASRGNDGEITFREWHPVGAQEYGYVAPDPLHPNIVFGGKLSEYNKTTGQVQQVGPSIPNLNARFLRTEPVIFSPVDPKRLYYAGNVLFETNNGGDSWQVISPDLSRDTSSLKENIPSSVGIYKKEAKEKMGRRGVIYSVAPSPLNVNVIWAGTDDGLIYLTKDGRKTWKNVTPADLSPWSKVSILDAGHFDTNTAYAAINRIRCDDMHPYVFKTKDGGKTWTKIIDGLPDNPINAIREDPVKKGLLFATSETAVYVSFNDGAKWESLRLNMPATSVRDLIIKDDDLAVATHGRGFWILDDMTPLRQIPDESPDENILFKPKTTYRVRWDVNTDTPLPPDEPAGQNPPDGAIINYYLKEKSIRPISLDIIDSDGNPVRHFSSDDTLYKIPPQNVPFYWIRPQQILSANAGSHRFIWDLHHTPLNLPVSFPIAAVYKNTAPAPTSPWVMPGVYTVKLTVNGKVYEQPLLIKMDPRVKTPNQDIKKQFDYSMLCYKGRKEIQKISGETVLLHNQIINLIPKANKILADSLEAFDKEIAHPEVIRSGTNVKNFSGVFAEFGSQMNDLQGSDMPPNNQIISQVLQTEKAFENLDNSWKKIKTVKLIAINKELSQAGLEILKIGY